MAIREGKWKCPSCDAVNLGRDMKCATCGTVRGPEVKFFLEDETPEVTDSGLLDTAKAGGDWHCDFCNTDNRAGIAVCRQCGASRDGMKRREAKLTGTANAPTVSPKPAPVSSRAVNPAKIMVPSVILLVLAIVGIWFFFGRGKEGMVRLEGGDWNREIAVERQEPVRHEAWRNEVPQDGRVLRSWEAQRSTERIQTGTERVKTGTKDMGNGFFEDVYEDKAVYKENPVYDIKVEYERMEWKAYRTATSSGKLGDEPVWPDPAIKEGDREGPRTERAILRFVSLDMEDEGKIFTYDKAKPSELGTYVVGQVYPVILSGDRVTRFREEE